MKRIAFVAVACVLSIACQRPAERSADAGAPSPSATPAAAATPASGGALPAEAPASEPAARAAAPQKAPAARAESAPAAPVAAPAEPEPTPTPKPAPTPKPKIVPSGTALAIVLEQELSTKSAKVEDPVVASLAEDVSVDGEVLLPKGAEVHGHVVSSVRSGRTKGRARIVVAFNEVRVNSRSYTIDATGFDVTAGSSKGKDAKIAGGSAAAGAIIGGIAGGGSGALKGGLIGGAVGGGAVLATRGVEVELKAGTPYKIELKKSLHVR
jgi:hypothetical protein